MTGSRHLRNASKIMIECVALRDGFQVATYNGFLNLEIEGHFKVIIDCYIKKGCPPSSILLLMEDIWRLYHNLNIYNYCRIYREANRTTDYLAKKGIYMTNSNILWSDFPMDVKKFAFEDYYGLSLNQICKFSYL